MRTVTTLSSILLMSAFLTACGGSKKDEEKIKPIKSDDCLSKSQLEDKKIPVRTNGHGCVKNVDLDDENAITILGREGKKIEVSFDGINKSGFVIKDYVKSVGEKKEEAKKENKDSIIKVEYNWVESGQDKKGTIYNKPGSIGFSFKGEEVSGTKNFTAKLTSNIFVQEKGTGKVMKKISGPVAPAFKIHFDLRDDL